MPNETYHCGYRPDTVTISADEYADLIRAAAQLDMILLLNNKSGTNPLFAAICKERNIVRTEE